MNGLISGWRRRRLFASPARDRRPVPAWGWIPFAAIAGALALLTALRALGVDGPDWYRWLTDPRQPLVPALFLGSIVASAALYGRARNSPGRVVGVLSVSAFAVGALVLGIASYINCGVDGPPFFEQLIWVLSGNGADPWGAAPGCPTQPPLAHHLARLCALWGALASVLGVVIAMLRRQIDRWLASWADRAVVVLGASAQAAAMVRVLAANRSPGSALLVVDHSGDEAFASTVRSLGGRVLAADAVDAELLRSLVTVRGRIAVEAVHIIEERVPEALATFAHLARVLDAAAPNEALVSRVLLRIDDPWAAENWRRSITSTERSWLADALSATEQTARALVARIDSIGARRLVVAGEGDLAVAVLAEVARCERERRVLQPGRDAPPLEVTVIGAGAAALAAEHTAQQARFGNDSGIAELRVIADPATDPVLVAAGRNELTTLLVIAQSQPELNRPTRLAGQLPEVTILAVDPASAELPDQPLVGRLTGFGIGLLTGDEPPEDHWTRIARLLHAAYLTSLGTGSAPGRRPGRGPNCRSSSGRATCARCTACSPAWPCWGAPGRPRGTARNSTPPRSTSSAGASTSPGAASTWPTAGVRVPSGTTPAWCTTGWSTGTPCRPPPGCGRATASAGRWRWWTPPATGRVGAPNCCRSADAARCGPPVRRRPGGGGPSPARPCGRRRGTGR